MRALRALRQRLSPAADSDAEIAEELEAHLQMHTDDNIRAGMTPEEARRAAVLKLGSVEATKEACRDERTVPVLDHLRRDARLGARHLRRSPAFSVTAIAVLALGIAASVGIFAFVDAALLRPLPYAEPSRLVGVYESHDVCALCNLSYLDFRDWQRDNRVLESLAVYRRSTMVLQTPSGPEAARGASVSADFFRTLGVAPALGRDFAADEERPGTAAVAVLTHGAWQRRFGGDPAVVGRSVELDGAPRTIVGVLPPSFVFAPTEPAEFWTVLQGTDSCSQRRSCHNLNGVGRLKPGVGLDQALADTRAIAARLESQFPDSNRGQGAAVVPLADVIVGPVRPVLLLLLVGALLLLAISAFNVTGLLVVRSEARRRELAVRRVLGASGARLLAQFATEALVLVGVAATIGFALAAASLRLLVRLIPAAMLPSLPFFQDLGLGGRALAFGATEGLAAVALFTLAPWLLAERSSLAALNAGERGSSGTVWRRVGGRLVVMELATAMLLLVGAGLLGRSVVRLMNVDLGLQASGLVLVDVGAGLADQESDERLARSTRQLRDAVAAVPGVASVALASEAPVGTRANTRWFRIVGRPYSGERNEAPTRGVTAGYFDTLGATLVRGRDFDARDGVGKPRVAIVNTTLVKQYFPAEDPIGQRIAYVAGMKEEMEIVGVVRDVREGALDAAPRAAIYQPLEQDPSPFFTVVARTPGEAAVRPAVSAAIRRASPGAVLRNETTMSERIDGSQAATLHRSTAWLVGGFAAVALLLSAVGLHGVVAYSVGQRTREIAIRMALGAEQRGVEGMVLRDAGRVVAAGLGLGLLASVAGSRAIEGLLFEVHPWDPAVLAAVGLVLALCALAAVALPARRAASVHPMEALRSE